MLSRLLPVRVTEFIRGCRYRGTGEHIRFLVSARRNRRRHDELNAGLPKTQIALGPGVTFVVMPEVRSTFEEFTHGNTEMVEEMAAFLQLAEGCRCFLDIGALYGAFSLAFCARTGERAIAFEPNRVSFAVLAQHVAANPSFRVEALPLGVGEASGTVEVEAGFHFTAVGTKTPGANPKAPLDRMEVISLDAYCAAQSLEPDLWKIDVEGFELFVLQGGRETLQRCRPKLLIEFHTDLMASHGHRLDAAVRFLEDLGYRSFTPRLQPIDSHWRRREGNLRGIFIPS